MSNAFPIKSKNPDGLFTGGTGFFATYRDRFWLVTAAHVLLGHNDRHCRWAEWPDEIAVGVGPGLTINIFDNQRRPLFAYKAEGDAVADIAALDWTSIADHPVLADVTRFDLAVERRVRIGDRITALGYPTDVDDWPHAPAAARNSEVVGVSPGLLEHRPEAGPGMSGGPVIDRNYGLVGLVMGHNHESAVSPSSRRSAGSSTTRCPTCRCGPEGKIRRIPAVRHSPFPVLCPLTASGTMAAGASIALFLLDWLLLRTSHVADGA